MTRKHYTKIAASLNTLINEQPEILEYGTLGRVVDALCAVFNEDNERFDSERFRAAVYAEEEN